MGCTDTMTASAPEEGRKCWLKVTLDGKSRMVEWNTSQVTFKEMDTKVRKMFGLNDKLKLLYTYKDTMKTEIIMSSDEELGTALHLMVGEILVVALNIERKKTKGPMCKMVRAAKAKSAYIANFIASLSAVVAAHVPSISAMKERVRASARASCAALHCARRNTNATANANANANPHPDPNSNPNQDAPRVCRNRSGKVFMGLVLLAAVFIAHAQCLRLLSDYQTFHQPHSQQYHNHNVHATILAASYGGQDVTRRAQDYYNQNGHLLPNNIIFGDPARGDMKFLHVVFQQANQYGKQEVFSQSFAESHHIVNLVPNRDQCAFPEEAIVDGRSVKILGALYDNTVATCAARKFAATGRFAGRRTDFVHCTNFGLERPVSGTGSFTMAYIKDNNIRIVTAKDGQGVVL